MELHYATVVILASMIFVLSGMVGYLYWQQTRMLQHIQSLAMVVSTQLVRPPSMPEPQIERDAEPDVEPQAVHEEFSDEEEVDDRISVRAEVEHVEGPVVVEATPEPAIEAPTATEPEKVDVDDLHDKTAAQLRELLTKKGIPFGKRDAKPVLIQLLKATA